MKTLVKKLSNIQTIKNPKKVFNSISFLFIENAVRLLIGFTVGVWIARTLGPHDYGLFTYVLSFSQLFLPFFHFGTNEYTIGLLSNKKSKHEEVMGMSFFIRLMGGLLGILVINLSLWILRPEDMIARKLVFIYSTALLLKAFDNIDCWYLSQTLGKRIASFRMVAMVLSTLFKLYLLMNNYSWESFIYVGVLELILYSITYVVAYHIDQKNIIFWKTNFSLFKKFLKNSLPLFAIAFLNMFLGRQDQIMLAEMKGHADLGKYALAVKLVDLWQFLPLAIISSIFPQIAEAKAKGEELFDKRSSFLYSAVLWPAVLFAVSVSLIAPYLINFLYGEQYQDVHPLLMAYSWTTLFAYFTLARGSILVVEEKSFDGVKVSLAALILNFLFNFILIPKYGAMGSIMASFMAYFGANLFASLFIESIRKSCKMGLYSLAHPVKFFSS